MTYAGTTGEFPDNIVPIEIAGHMAHRSVRMKMLGVECSDSSGFLAAMLQGVEPERDEARRIVGTPNPENAALLAQLIVVERIGRQHSPGSPERNRRCNERVI
jgi:hypothetical protein